MKLRITILILLTALLSACNMTLAEDVTPPPGYIPPTPMPTLVLVPPQRPNTSNGEAIFFEKCAPCHGDTGLGDGPQGIQLGVTVPAFALPEVARPSSPAQWYTTVTRGKIERFMPPFVSLNDQQRWDVVAYIMTLHTSEEQIQKGKELFEANCAGCSTDYYKDLNNVSGLSTVALARIVRLGNDQIQAFGENLSDDDMWAVAEYLRSLSYDTTPPAAPTAVPATPTIASADAGTTSAEGTPVDGQQVEVPAEATPVAVEGFGTVSGSIENKTGKDLSSNFAVTLRGYEHDFANPSAGTQEVLTLDGFVQPNGTFSFENVEMPENRIFIAEINYEGIGLTSEFTIVEAGQTLLEIPPLTLYNITDDTSKLTMDEVNLFLSADKPDEYEILALYTFRNASDSTVSVAMGSQEEIPFLKFPTGTQGLGYEAVQDSARFISTNDGFAMAPNELPYGILAYSSLAQAKEISISQPFILPAAIVRIFVPEGMKAESDQITDDGLQDVQGLKYQAYSTNDLKAGDVLTFTVTGSAKAAPTATDGTSPNNTLLIGAGALGILLLLIGGWTYLRDRNRTDEEDGEGEDDDEEEFESADDVMDAIIALDDLHRTKKISDENYQKRRSELKEILKEMM